MKRRSSLDDLPELGVGITYSSAIEPLIEQHPGLFDVLEIEPQTSWMEQELGSGIYRISDPVLKHIAELPGKKLIHSIGMPVGSSKEPDPHQLALLDRTIRALDAPWMSEHLSFNNGHDFFTGFFLPPRQSEAGVQTAIHSIRKIQEKVSIPLAIETGVNYLRPRKDEMADGMFVGKIAEGADCGILLDLHNIWTNQLNGRQRISEFLDQIPLERVLEIHLAGGMELNGFWLDAHSGAMPKELIDITRELIPHLPNVKAIIYEIFPSFVPLVGLDLIKGQITLIKGLWNERPAKKKKHKSKISAQPLLMARQPENSNGGKGSVIEWESAIGRLVTGQTVAKDNRFEEGLKDDPGIKLVEGLIKEFRASMVVRVLQLSSRFLMLALGPDIFRAFLEDFWSKHTPSPLTSAEAANFGAYMQTIDLKVPNFDKLLEFELAVLATLIDDKARVVTFVRDPLPLFRALAEGKLPTVDMMPGQFEIEVTSDGPVSANGLRLQDIQVFFPNH